MKPWRRPWFVVPVSVGLVLGLGGGALAAFSATTTDGVNQFVAATDWEPPHVTRTIIAKTPGYLGGKSVKAASSSCTHRSTMEGTRRRAWAP